MSKTVSPSISLQSFTCPRCGANSHQNWFDLHAEGTEKNLPTIFDVERYEALARDQENTHEDQKIPESSMKYFEKLADGDVFIRTPSSARYVYHEIHNLHLSSCYSCKELSIWLYDTLIYPPEPEAEEPNEDMPKSIRKDYEEARLIFKHSAKGAAALLRLCIEKLCNHLDAEGKDLNAKIGDLVKKGMNKKVQMALDSVRVIGNEAVHPGQIDLNDNKDIARALFKLVNQIVKELITEDREIKEIYAVLPEEKKEGIEKRDTKEAAGI